MGLFIDMAAVPRARVDKSLSCRGSRVGGNSSLSGSETRDGISSRGPGGQ